MAQHKLGTKRTCPSCQTKYYDFDKPTPVCPKCGSPAILTRPWETPAKNRRPAGGLGAALGMLAGGAGTDAGDDLDDTLDSLPSGSGDEDSEDGEDGDGDIETDAEDEYLPTGEAKAKPPAASPEDLDDDSGLDEFEGYEIYDDGVPPSEDDAGDDDGDDGGDGLDEDFDGGGEPGDDDGFEPEPEPARKPRRQARR